MSTNRKKARQKANRTTGKSAAQMSSRERKRAEFSGNRSSRKILWIALTVAAIAVIAIVGVVVVTGKKGATAATVAPVVAATDTGSPTSSGGAATGGAVKLLVSKVSDGQTHFYTSQVGGVAVKYFVMKAPDGTLRTAFDSCNVCYPFKKGYHQQGTAVQCNNCGRVFPSAEIDVQRGGCNPGPINAKVVGKDLVIPAAQLKAGVQFFQ